MNVKRMKQAIATVALAGAVTAGSTGIAVAADDTGSAPAGAQAESARHHRHAVRHAIGRITSETLGVTRADLRAALKSGQSIAGYAESLGQDPQAVVDALVDAANERIDRAVANGRISEARGAEIKANVPDRVNSVVNRTFGSAGGS